MKKTILTALILHCFGLIQAQFNLPPYVVPNTDWINYANSRGNVANGPTAIDANNNMFLTGYTGSSPSSCNILTQKYDSLGTLIFSASYNNGNYDKGNALKVNGTNVHVAGVSYATATNNDYIVIKYSGTGSQLWAYRYDLAGQDDEATDIKVDAAGNSYVTGTARNSNGDLDIVTFKLNPSGTLQWVHVYNGISNLDDVATGLVIIGNDIFVAGYTTDATNGTDVTVFQLDGNTGTFGWETIVNGTANGNDKPNAVTISGADVLVCGEIDNTGTGLDALTCRLNGTSGATVFQQSYDYGTTNNRATAMVRDSMGNIGVVGTALNGSVIEYHATFYDSTGVLYSVNRETTNLSVSNVNPRIACDTIAHHFYVCGEKMNLSKDVFVYQLTPSGNTSWRKSYDGYNNADIDAGIGIAVNGVGVVYVGALSQNTAGQYDYTAIRINQTPAYYPPDVNNEAVNMNHLYLPNKGQLIRTDSVLANEVLYYTHNTVPEIYIERNAFNYVYRRDDNSAANIDTVHRVQCTFLNSNPLSEPHEYLPRSTNYNYFLGYAASPEITDIRGHERIFTPNLYPGIDLHYFSCKGGLKYYFVIKPYHTNEIQLNFDGAESISIDGTTGNLKLNGVIGNMEFTRPVFYTVNMLGQPVSISGSASWVQNSGNVYQIGLPAYSMTMPVVIMIESVQSAAAVGGFGPKGNLDYSTYYGSGGGEVFKDIKASTNGDRHITGWTDNAAFPKFKYLFNYLGQKDAVILRYTADDTLRVATFYGGARDDEGTSITVDNSGGIYVGGWTESSDFKHKALNGAFTQTVNGLVSTVGYYRDGFLAKFSVVNPTLPSQGMLHNWGSYIGGSGQDQINSIYRDSNGNICFTGESASYTMSAITNAAQASNSKGNVVTTNPSTDVIVGKLTSSLSMTFCTFLGGNSSPYAGASREYGSDITVDNSGRITVVGKTDATNFPTANTTGNTNTFFDNTPPGTFDGFITRYSPAGTVQFSSFFGGSGIDEIQRVYYNGFFDEYYFAGYSYDTTAFPFVFKSGALNTKYKINKNAFIAKMDGNLTKQWATYYGKGKGGSKEFDVTGLASDGYGVVYMSGRVTSDTLMQPANAPTTVVYKDSVVSARDGYIAIFNPDNSLYHAHYFGGTNDDDIWNLDVSQGQNLYIVGGTRSDTTQFPIAYNAINATLIDSINNGGDDGFISRFQLINYQVTDIKTYDFDKASLMVYPNPANTEFVIELEGQEQTKPVLRVFNIMGQLIHQQLVTENSTRINCQNWVNGVYLVSVSNNTNQSTFKLIKSE